jgi:hypothetical protein
VSDSCRVLNGGLKYLIFTATESDWTLLHSTLIGFLTFKHFFVRLTGDIRWPAWTPFDVAIGPLAQSFPILSLRTNKADVVVGVKKEVAEHLDQSDPKWRVDGR